MSVFRALVQEPYRRFQKARLEPQFLDEGRDAEGLVTDLDSYTDSQDHTTYWAVFEWEDTEGARHIGKEEVPDSPPPAMLVGKRVRVRYLPTDPSRSKIDEILY